VAGRPPKPFEVLVSEKKSHRTKAELETRKKAEKALLTGSSLKEWPDVKANPSAHKEFYRLKKLLKKISHDDALYESVINRYCLLMAECQQFEEMKNSLTEEIQELKQLMAAGQIDALIYIEHKGKLQDRIMSCDKKVMEKRKMMLQIEKENVMTIMGALRAIPKKPPKEENEDPMAALLNRKAGGR